MYYINTLQRMFAILLGCLNFQFQNQVPWRCQGSLQKKMAYIDAHWVGEYTVDHNAFCLNRLTIDKCV